MSQHADSGVAVAAKASIPAGYLTWTTVLGQPVDVLVSWATLLFTLLLIAGWLYDRVYRPWKAARAKKRRASDVENDA